MLIDIVMAILGIGVLVEPLYGGTILPITYRGQFNLTAT